MDVCTNPDILKVMKFLLIILDIIKIIIPICLIIYGMIDMSKSVVSNNEDMSKKNIMLFFKRVLYGVIIFIIPWFIEVFMITLGDLLGETGTTNFTDCIDNVDRLDYYEQLADIKKQKELEKKEKERELQKLNNNENKVIKQNSVSSDSSEGSFIGQKYNLTEKQLKEIARLCQQEQGTAVGAAAEASLMANQFELFGSKYGTGGSGLHNYVATSGWFYNAQGFMAQTDSLRDDVYTSVYNVLILGQRTLPFYIDEHDCIKCGSTKYDIIKLEVNNDIITDKEELLNRDNYIKNETIIYNRHSSIYTFYTFPTSTSDPFGYTKRAKDKYDLLNKN